ncbi:MAG: DUF434 domain-containing protein [Proteobacteria bacterium]|nr:DUF434 domain-containing protein [Pseudomonadota bacterium]
MKSIRRGYLPEYESTLRDQGVNALGQAVIDALFLLNRGHSLKRAAHIAMEHYQLTDHQRIALTRGIASDDEIRRRSLYRLCKDDVRDKTVYLDGFNAIILMESLVSGSPVFRCMDGAIRDLANLKGSYHIIDKTEPAIRLILQAFDNLRIHKAIIHIDNPVSNSRNLKNLINTLAGSYHVEIDVDLIDACDKSFYDKACVISGDGIVIDHARSWIPLYLWIVEEYQLDHDVWLIDFDAMSKAYRKLVNTSELAVLNSGLHSQNS